VVVKTTPDAFVRTALEARLREAGAATVVIAGVITNNSVEATARTAGNLGFQTFVVDDAVFTFAKRDFRGRLRSAEEVHDMSLANLAGEYATITTTADVLASVG
jgi:nicotinamidase-related amidase